MRTGQCLCGDVTYEMNAEPQMVVLCHCRACQSVSGGGPAVVAVFPAGSFRLTKGALKTYWRQADSGAKADRHFCADCGTHLVSRLQDSPFVAVKVGTLDAPLEMTPQLEIWTSTAPPWAHHIEGATRFERNAV